MREITIRTASPDDAEELLAIYTYYVEKTAVSFEYEPPTAEEFCGRIVDALRRYPYLCIIENGEIAGFAFAHAFRERRAYDYAAESTIYLRHDKRRCGLGAMIYTALEKALRRMGVTNMYACVAVPEGDDPYLTNASPVFHEKMGFRKCGEFYHCGYKFGRRYTMIWMEKLIGDMSDNLPEIIPYNDSMLDEGKQ